MNDEIKLDHFKNIEELKQNVETWIKEDEMYWNRWFSLYDLKTVLDYITNLQEENENLKDRLKVMKHFKNSLLEENEDYKSRCEKAIEFIKEEAGYDEEIRSCCCDLLYSDCDKLIELLGGDDKQ